MSNLTYEIPAVVLQEDAVTKAPAYSGAEEIANIVTHGIGVLISLLALGYIMVAMPSSYSFLQKSGVVVYGLTLVLMFSSSTLYHAVQGPFRRVLRCFDHCAIYLLIAGTYTPILSILLDSQEASSLLAVLWISAFVGVIFKTFFTGRFEFLAVTTFIAMGGSAVLVMGQIKDALDPVGLMLLIVGGAAYIVGVVFYSIKAISFNHAIWHIFVLIGALTHCWLILGYVVSA